MVLGRYSVVQKRARVSGICHRYSFDNRIRFIQTNVSLYSSTVSYYILGIATAPVSMPTAYALPGRTHWGEISQAGKHASSNRRYIRVHNTKQDEKNAVFRRNIHEVGETVLFRQYVPVALLLLWILLVLGALYCQSHTDIFTSMSTYKGTICVSKRTHRHSHEACMNVLSVEQYQTTYCRLG